MKITEKLTGFFNVRKYKEGKPREQWAMLSDGENITFNTVFHDLPADFQQFAKEYTDASGNRRWRVSFKITPRCRWYDHNAEAVDRPTNSELDGKRYNARISYNVVIPSNPDDTKAARGFWANAIQYEEYIDNPFTPLASCVSMPTFEVYKSMAAVDEVSGEEEVNLKNLPY